MTAERIFARSDALLARALEHIPLGTQTFSKSVTQYPRGIAPHYAARAQGSRLHDADGNEYVDFVNALCAVTLGYNDPDVTAAVRAQLEDGVLFSLPHPIEIETAEALCEMVPCAEMVRFGKNGSDATAGAVRLARAHTGRDRVAVCGYHGWQDWYIGTTTRDAGVPRATSALTHGFAYNRIETLDALFRAHPGAFAAVILEPLGPALPEGGFLEAVRERAHAHGALLIFDEMVTGFRVAEGGAQALFGVTPDLACFGKGLANGFPLSAVAGRAEIMRGMEEVFFSFTMGGETLSLAAALAVMRKLKRENVTARLAEQGRKVMDGVARLIARHEVGHLVSISGHPSWSFLTFADAGRYRSWEIVSLFLQEAIARGILIIGTHNMSYAHSDDDIERLLAVYDEVFPILREAVAEGSIETRLRGPALKPLFRVR